MKLLRSFGNRRPVEGDLSNSYEASQIFIMLFRLYILFHVNQILMLVNSFWSYLCVRGERQPCTHAHCAILYALLFFSKCISNSTYLSKMNVESIYFSFTDDRFGLSK